MTSNKMGVLTAKQFGLFLAVSPLKLGDFASILNDPDTSLVFCFQVVSLKGPQQVAIFYGVLVWRLQKSGVHSPVEVGSLPHYLQGFARPSWCTMSSIHRRYTPPKKETPESWNPRHEILWCRFAVCEPFTPGSYLLEVWVFVPSHHRSSILRTIKSPNPEISRWVMRIL